MSELLPAVILPFIAQNVNGLTNWSYEHELYRNCNFSTCFILKFLIWINLSNIKHILNLLHIYFQYLKYFSCWPLHHAFKYRICQNFTNLESRGDYWTHSFSILAIVNCIKCLQICKFRNLLLYRFFLERRTEIEHSVSRQARCPETTESTLWLS